MRSALRIAIVDDSQDNAEMLQAWLEQEGHAVSCFFSGHELMNDFEAGAYDLLLLDIAMPNMTGFEVFDSVRKIDHHVPIVAVSANVFPADKERAIQYGFKDFIEKPIWEVQNFCEQITKHVTGRA